MTGTGAPASARSGSGLAGAAARRDRFLSDVENYLFIGGDQMSARQAAWRLGVTVRTIQRYRRHLREASPCS